MVDEEEEEKKHGLLQVQQCHHQTMGTARRWGRLNGSHHHTVRSKYQSYTGGDNNGKCRRLTCTVDERIPVLKAWDALHELFTMQCFDTTQGTLPRIPLLLHNAV